jgi:hypothetical protein
VRVRGDCEAAGYYSDIGTQLQQPFVVRQVHGTWRNAQLIPGMRALSGQDKNFVFAEILSISCPSAGNCAAGGMYSTSPGHTQALVVNEVRGTWRQARIVPAAAS